MEELLIAISNLTQANGKIVNISAFLKDFISMAKTGIKSKNT
jgi:hypothetical protein